MMTEPALRIVRMFGPWDFSNAHNALRGRVTQRQFAGFYADCIRADGSEADWLSLNEAVIARWPKGLARVKTMAWKELRAGR